MVGCSNLLLEPEDQIVNEQTEDPSSQDEPEEPYVVFFMTSSEHDPEPVSTEDPDPMFDHRGANSGHDPSDPDFWGITTAITVEEEGAYYAVSVMPLFMDIEVDVVYQANGEEYTLDNVHINSIMHIDLPTGIDFYDSDGNGQYDMNGEDYPLFAISEVRYNGEVVWTNLNM